MHTVISVHMTCQVAVIVTHVNDEIFTYFAGSAQESTAGGEATARIVK